MKRLAMRLLGYRTRRDGDTAIIVTFPRWYPEAEVARRCAEMEDDEQLVVTRLGREVRIADRSADLLRRLADARARL